MAGVERLNRRRAIPWYLPEPNSEYHHDYLGSQSARDKLRGREGNNPDHLLRSLSRTQSLRKSSCNDSQDVGLEAAII
jgi:hypothetical protein